ncbi:DUF2927 domain-containing protein [Vibrio sp. SCSIO 43135]|uniref:DUF2927 domain-containing protein n=1 Tax=Vibrio sp. SCSIO 43135 TaxID=2819096 RepID=UPI00207634C4|nr:DUF2927 domain-containing protein [Vibrio sp. SCSIO 43135]USD40165.1 DUF2927 domain-containing protein [Vibrio sp. SCSIO 43135]
MLRIAVLLFTIFSATSSVLAAGETWYDSSFVKRAFFEVALKNEYRTGYKPLNKWDTPVKIWVIHQVPDVALHDELTDLHIQHLTDITSFPIERAKSEQEANIRWIYTNEKQWVGDIEKELGKASTKNLRGVVCKAGYRVNSSTKNIVQASIIIPVDQARERGKLLACIVEEITQVLGLPNDSPHAYPSIFNDETPDDLLSPLDIVLLQLLYEPELKSGMTKSQLEPVVSKILNRYQSQGVLSGAVQEAKGAPLYQLLR